MSWDFLRCILCKLLKSGGKRNKKMDGWKYVITLGELGTLFSAVIKFDMVQLEKCENMDTLLEGAPDYHDKWGGKGEGMQDGEEREDGKEREPPFLK